MMLLHGFELIHEQEIGELNTLARIYRHAKTGAELLSLINDDENKVFGISFRTPPADSTGVAHILEHSVLCGSRKYPVKEPFVELLKGSLQTFLNAMTYPDKTCYPVASQNVQDFYNLIDVYLDAVFYPRLTPFVFQQEGWHIELDAPDNPFAYKGVVFNEMKGAYSSPDNILSQYSLQSLFPDTAYGFDSGGDPKKIPNLTFEQFRNFHTTFYHPSNARIYFYGDDDPEERLKVTNAYIRAFDRMDSNSTVAMQAPFSAPRRLTQPFMAQGEGGAPAKGMVTFNWLFPPTADVELNLACHMLEYILLGMPGSPLRKALIDSGLGEDLAGEGLGAELQQLYFSTGLKGIDISSVDRIEDLVLSTLHNLAHKGIDGAAVDAACNTVEFRLRENNSGSFPRGLLLMLRSLTTWLYDGDPLALLAFEAALDAIKKRIRSGGGFFENMIDRLFLNNPHRTTLVLHPDPDFQEKAAAAERDRLEKVRKQMPPEHLDELVANTATLKRLQEQPDPPEALKRVPVLSLNDLDKKNKTIPIDVHRQQESTLLFHDLFTNGITYLDVGLDLRCLPARFLPYVPLFGRALVEMGTEREDFVSLTQRISRKTGGIRPHWYTAAALEGRQDVARLFLRGKSVTAGAYEMLEIFRDVLLTVRLDDRERFRQMVLEAKARAEERLVARGHQMVNQRIQSHFCEAHWAAEQMGGISYLFFLRRLENAVEEKWSEVLETLHSLKRHLVNRRSMIFNITLDPEDRPGFAVQLEALIEALPEAPLRRAEWGSETTPLFEGMTVPSQVNYVGKGANLYELGYRFHGAASVIARYIRNAWLWERVRVQGGAYGAFCLFDRFSGTLVFVSYRDPNLLQTLAAFDKTAEFLAEAPIDEKEVQKSIIGTIGDLDAYMLPDAKGYASMLRYLVGDRDAGRQRMREEILGTGIAHFRAFAPVLKQLGEKGVVKVLGSEGAVNSAVAARPGWLTVMKVL